MRVGRSQPASALSLPTAYLVPTALQSRSQLTVEVMTFNSHLPSPLLCPGSVPRSPGIHTGYWAATGSLCTQSRLLEASGPKWGELHEEVRTSGAYPEVAETVPTEGSGGSWVWSPTGQALGTSGESLATVQSGVRALSLPSHQLPLPRGP